MNNEKRIVEKRHFGLDDAIPRRKNKHAWSCHYKQCCKHYTSLNTCTSLGNNVEVQVVCGAFKYRLCPEVLHTIDVTPSGAMT